MRTRERLVPVPECTICQLTLAGRRGQGEGVAKLPTAGDLAESEYARTPTGTASGGDTVQNFL